MADGLVGQQQAAGIAGKQQALLNNSTLQRQNYFNLLMKMYGQQNPSAPAGGGSSGTTDNAGTTE